MLLLLHPGLKALVLSVKLHLLSKYFFLNIQKPEMDGYEVAMRIWKLRSRVLPLIIVMIATYDDDVSD